MRADRSVTALAMVLVLTLCASQNSASAPDELTVTFIGTGSPRVNLERSGPSILIEAAGRRFLVDVGPGARERIFVAGGFELVTEIDHILLTHLHYDHVANVPDIWLTGWLYGRSKPLLVQGPAGTERSIGHLRRAYGWDVGYRIAVGIPDGAARTAVHTTPQQVGELFARAKPAMAVYSHIIPLETTSDELVGLTRPYYNGPITVAHDLMTITLRGDDDLIVGERERSGTVSYHQQGL